MTGHVTTGCGGAVTHTKVTKMSMSAVVMILIRGSILENTGRRQYVVTSALFSFDTDKQVFIYSLDASKFG